MEVNLITSIAVIIQYVQFITVYIPLLAWAPAGGGGGGGKRGHLPPPGN